MLLASDDFNNVQWSFVSISFSEIQLIAGSLQACKRSYSFFYIFVSIQVLILNILASVYIASSNQIATLEDSTNVPWARDDNLILLDSNRAVASTEFGPAYSNKLSW